MKKTYLYAGISILLWSSLATVSKLLLGTLNSFQVLCVSSLFAALALLAVNLFTGNLKKLRSFRPKDLVTIVLIGLPGTFFYYIFLYLGTERMPASQAFIINYLWPIMSVVFACILLKERLTPRKGIAIAMSFLGVITVAGKDLLRFDTGVLIGGLFCVLAALSYGSFTALNQKWQYDKPLSMMLAFFVSFVLSLGITVMQGAEWELGAAQWMGLGWNGVTVMAVATVTWALALDRGNTAKISNLAYLTPFLSLIWTFLFLQEPISPWSLAGLCIIVLGIMIQLKDTAKPRSHADGAAG